MSVNSKFNLSTPCLTIKPLDKNDFTILKKWYADPQVMHYQGGVWDQEQQAAMLNRTQAHWKLYGFGYYMLVKKAEAASVGLISLKYLTDEEAKLKIPNLGYLIDPDFWGRGFATEASLALLDHAKNDLCFSKVQATSFLENKAGNRVLEKLGFQWIETVKVNAYGRDYEEVSKWQKEL